MNKKPTGDPYTAWAGAEKRLNNAMDTISELRTELARLEVEHEQIRDAIAKIIEWRDKAYPLDVFPEPDLKVLRELFGDTNITLLSASNMRHVTKRVCEILEAALQGGAK